MSDRAVESLLAAWALDAVSSSERTLIDAWLSCHAAARREAELLSAAAAVLGSSIPPVPAPTGLRSRVMAAVDGLPGTRRPA